MKKKKQIKILRQELASASSWATYYHQQAQRSQENFMAMGEVQQTFCLSPLV
jgi:hypothetical protein